MDLKIKSFEEYQEQYQKSQENPAEFWNKIAQQFSWEKQYDNVLDYDFKAAKNDWFSGGKLNITNNCLDRHLLEKANDIAIIWESNDPKTPSQKLTYKELHQKTCQFAHLLKKKGIEKGDRISIYMPMIPEAVVAMLGCARVGAIHSVVFAGFSAQALADRVNDSGAKLVITSDILYRGAKTIQLFDIVSEAAEQCENLKDIIIYRRSNEALNSNKNLINWQEEIKDCSDEYAAEIMDSEDPLFILYTSGSTGKPKGVMHSSAGYMVYGSYSFQNVFQYQDKDVFFCTADIGWITGHTYLTYGPLLSGATILMFEGVPTYPDASRFWQIIDKHQVNIFYTAPTAIRALMKCGDQYLEGYSLNSLKTLGTVGEPINAEAWEWYHKKIGKEKCPIVDTWWQTETGGILISSLAGVTESNPTFAGLPLPGVVPHLLDNEGKEILESETQGNLCFKHPWPSMIRSTWGDHERCKNTYFSQFPGYYFAGDAAFRAEDGNYRIIGRVDDVINVSGHRLGTAEIEDAINMHEFVTESAVIGVPHDIKGEGVHAFVISNQNNDAVKQEINNIITKQIGGIARPDKITIVPDLPKTRSGKIMRRILKKISANDNDLGDITTLVNPEIVKILQNSGS